MAVYNTTEYSIWMMMKQRCYNPNSSRYKFYGGRGIKISDSWKYSFSQFLSDMGKRPGKEYSIERNDNDGDYCKDNCRWATMTEQCANRRSTPKYSYKGELVTMMRLVEISGVKRATLWARINKIGMTAEEAVSPNKKS